MITEHQYQKLMNEYQQSGEVGRAALKAAMDRKTAARYIALEHGPEDRPARWWRTREDPLKAVWPEVERWLGRAPELEAKALFEHLLANRPGELSARALRTFYERVAQWKRENGVPREVFFPQAREPGRSVQLDWTYANDLKVVIGGTLFRHLLCHTVAPYSNWEWAVPCRSESFLSLKAGLSGALWELGGVTAELQTDRSSTATHQLRRGAKERGFNPEYLAYCEHLKIEPRTINAGCPEENGDVESAHGHLKRRLEAHLVLRGSREFKVEIDYAAFVAQVCRGANALRQAKVREEIVRLRPLPETRYPEAEELAVRVSSFSTVRIKDCAYSVPSQLIRAWITALVTESEVIVVHAGREVARYRRRRCGEPAIDYRHIIHSLVKKPGAFAGYIYRDELFPRPVFRQAYDRLKVSDPKRCDTNYVRVLAIAAEVGEEQVADALGALLREEALPHDDAVRGRLAAPASGTPAMACYEPQLGDYDQLLEVGA